MAEPGGITTKEWREAGLAFELWLRYAQAPESKRREVEKQFRFAYPEISNRMEAQND